MRDLEEIDDHELEPKEPPKQYNKVGNKQTQKQHSEQTKVKLLIHFFFRN